MKINFPWESISWETFEDLSLYLAEDLMPEISFSLYLKRGNKQHGIDISAFIDSNGKEVCIQCKKTRTLTKNQIKSAISEFLENKFASNTQYFIIATKADLQNDDLQDAIRTWKKNLQSKGIKFDCWDVNFFEKQLKKSYRITSGFFGKALADAYCFDDYADIKVTEVQKYIPRKLTELDSQRGYSLISDAASTTLDEIYLNNELLTRN